MSTTPFSRRALLGGAAATATTALWPGPASARRVRPRWKSPNETLAIAAIGAGGKAEANLEGCAHENIVALCDVDGGRAAKSFAKFPNATRYTDFRQMLDKERSLDAVIVTTPDHTHAVAAQWAMERGLHVYLEKPLCRTIHEIRRLHETAKRTGVATQMGNAGHSSDRTRRLCEIIWRGDLGPVREVHVWTNRPIWPQGLEGPLPAATPPPDFDWDLWLGPAAKRGYNPGYAPFKWRGWHDFGCGALGDMGCHNLDPANWALGLGVPTSVVCTRQTGGTDACFPKSSIVKYEFPARAAMPAVTIHWYDGGLFPARHERVRADLVYGDNGAIFVGDRGVLAFGLEDPAWKDKAPPATVVTDAGVVAADPRGGLMIPGTLGTGPQARGTGGALWLFRDDLEKGYVAPEPVLTRAPSHYRDWLRACKGGERAGSCFDYAAPFTEWVLLGTIAQRYEGQPLSWDAKAGRFTNHRDANRWVKQKARAGWAI